MIGIFFSVRLASKRLKEKHLINVNGKSFVEWLILRFQTEFSLEIENNAIKLFIITSDENNSYLLEEIFNSDKKTNIYFGDTYNIPKRHLDCAVLNNLKAIISIDGDDILCSTEAARKIYNELLCGKELIKTIGLPLGMNSMGFSKNYLSKCLETCNLIKLETGWGKIFKDSDYTILEFNNDNFSCSDLRFTLDYKEDSTFFKKIFVHYGNEILQVSDSSLIDFVKNQELYKINSELNEGYWINFHNESNLENE